MSPGQSGLHFDTLPRDGRPGDPLNLNNTRRTSGGLGWDALRGLDKPPHCPAYREYRCTRRACEPRIRCVASCANAHPQELAIAPTDSTPPTALTMWNSAPPTLDALVALMGRPSSS
jgi:hypothetical protein